MSGEKFIRVASLAVNEDTVIERLRMRFEVDRGIDGFVSTAHIEIYNMGSEGRSALQQPNASIRFTAGYENNKALLFSGAVTSSISYRETPDRITEVWARDIGDVQDEPVSSISIRKPKSLVNVIRTLADNAGYRVGELNIEDAAMTGALTFSESFSHAMNTLAKAYGFTWYIANDLLTVFALRAESQKRLYTFNALSGLLDTPILTNIGIDVSVLLEPGIMPFDLYNVESTGLRVAQAQREVAAINLQPLGTQKVLQIKHTGDTHSTQWVSSIRGINRQLSSPLPGGGI